MNAGNHVDSRWRDRLWATITCAVGFVVIYPMSICGCHFHSSAVVVNAIPVLWGFYALATYQDQRERVVGWMAFAVAMFSIWVGCESNIVFAFR